MAKVIDEQIRVSVDDRASAVFARMEKSLGVLADAATRTDRKLEDLNNTAKKSKFDFGALANVIAGVGLVQLGSQAIQLADRFDFLRNRISVSTNSVAEMESSLDALVKISAKTGTSLENNAVLFQRLAIAAQSLGATNADMLKLTETVANLGRLSGSSTEDMKNATRQLAQALGNSRLQAEEFNSVVDQMPATVAEIAKEMGYLPFEFGRAVKEGEILSKDVYDALLRASDRVNARAAELPKTFAQSKQALSDGLIVTVGNLNRELGVTQTLSSVMQYLAENADALEFAIKGTTVALVAATAALTTFNVASFAAANSMRAFWIAATGPVGIITTLATVLIGGATAMALFGDSADDAKYQVDDLNSSLDRMTVNQARKAVSDYGSEFDDTASKIAVLNRQIEEFTTKTSKSATGKVFGPSRGELMGEDPKELTKLKDEVKKLEEQQEGRRKQLERSQATLDGLMVQEALRADRLAAQTENEIKAEQRRYEQFRSNYEDESRLALEKFEANNQYINGLKTNDTALLERYKQNNAEELRDTLLKIEEKNNAEKVAGEKKLEALEAQFASENELIEAAYEKRREIIEKYAPANEQEDLLEKARKMRDEELARQLERDEAEAEREKIRALRKSEADNAIYGQHAKFLASMEHLDKMSGKQKVQIAASATSDLLANAAQYSKKAFQINKAYQTGQAIIEGIGAIQKAWNLPWPLNLAAVAVVAANTAMQVRRIQSATYGGGGTTISAGGAGGAVTASPPVPQNSTAAPVIQRNQDVRVTIDNIDDDGLYSGKMIRKITEEIARQVQDGVTNVRFA